MCAAAVGVEVAGRSDRILVVSSAHNAFLLTLFTDSLVFIEMSLMGY